jgi:hypothetical protein
MSHRTSNVAVGVEGDRQITTHPRRMLNRQHSDGQERSCALVVVKLQEAKSLTLKKAVT